MQLTENISMFLIAFLSATSPVVAYYFYKLGKKQGYAMSVNQFKQLQWAKKGTI